MLGSPQTPIAASHKKKGAISEHSKLFSISTIENSSRAFIYKELTQVPQRLQDLHLASHYAPTNGLSQMLPKPNLGLKLSSWLAVLISVQVLSAD